MIGVVEPEPGSPPGVDASKACGSTAPPGSAFIFSTGPDSRSFCLDSCFMLARGAEKV